MKEAAYWIEKLNLQKHPEGGWFKETYRSEEIIADRNLPERYGSDRCFSTCIYYMLEGNDQSVFHRLKSDEFWHFYAGTSAIRLYVISPNGILTQYLLGSNSDNEEVFQVLIPREHWFAAELTNTNGYALIGCTVAPGFVFDDFEMGKQSELKKLFTEHSLLIERFSNV